MWIQNYLNLVLQLTDDSCFNVFFQVLFLDHVMFCKTIVTLFTKILLRSWKILAIYVFVPVIAPLEINAYAAYLLALISRLIYLDEKRFKNY